MFRMNLGSGESDGHVIVSLRGELDLVDAKAVAAALRTVAARGRWIIVDLSGLEFIDAAGVAALSRGRRQARNAGGGLLLAAPRPQVRLVLSLIWEADRSSVHAAWQRRPPVRTASRQLDAPTRR
jgi:anti-sigma B factor antagonist